MPKRIYHCDKCEEYHSALEDGPMFKARLQSHIFNGRKWVPDGKHRVFWLCSKCAKSAARAMMRPQRKAR